MKIEIYEVNARSFEGRLPLTHKFSIAGKSKEDVREAVRTRWPELYDVRITKNAG